MSDKKPTKGKATPTTKSATKTKSAASKAKVATPKVKPASTKAKAATSKSKTKQLTASPRPFKVKKPSKIILICGIAAVIMFAFCFAMVPLYSMLCKATGIDTSSSGTDLLSPVSATLTEKPDLTREVTVQFTTTNHNGMTWDFYPKVKSIKVHPGENNKVLFYIKNPSNKEMTVQAIPSMTPTDALGHFHKIECFCFTQQTLKAQESKDMPMIFRIDTDLPKNIHVITLAYTLYDVTPAAPRKG